MADGLEEGTLPRTSPSMLQCDRKSHQSTAASKTKNFLALNKVLVKTKSKSEAVKRKDKETGPQKKKILSKPTSAGRSSDNNDVSRNQHKSEETVTISKDYLERLLRQNLIKDSDTVSSSQNDKSEVTPTHIVVEHDQIPGLGHQTNTNRPKGARPNRGISKGTVPVDAVYEEPQCDYEERRGGGDIPHVSHVSPRLGGSYHRGTMNRPVHPAMRSSIDFGGGGDRRWIHQETNKTDYYNDMGHHDGKRRKKEDNNITIATSKLQQTTVDQVHSSPRSSMDVFQSHKDGNKTKELVYREELRLQIEENKRLRENEKIKRDMEERREEERLERERERLAWEFEREKERQRLKEIEASQKLAILYERTQLAKEAALAEKTKTKHHSDGGGGGRIMPSSYQQTVSIDQEDLNQQLPPSSLLHASVVSTDFDLRSPSMLQAIPKVQQQQQQQQQATGGTANRSPQRHAKLDGGGVGRRPGLAAVQGTGSQISLHSTSSEEPTVAASSKGKDKATINVKTASGLVRENRVQRRHAIKKQMDSKKSDSESEAQEKIGRHRPGMVGGGRGGKVIGGGKASSGRPIANSVARSTKQVLQRSLKEQSHNRTVRLREVPALSSPDIQDLSYPPPPPPPPRSPPVPTVAKRLAQEQQTGYVNDIHDLPGPDVTFSVIPVEQTDAMLPQIITSVQDLPTVTIPRNKAKTSNPLPYIIGNTNHSTLLSSFTAHNGGLANSNNHTVLPSITGAAVHKTNTVVPSVGVNGASHSLSHIARGPSCSPDIDQTSLTSSNGKKVLPPIMEIRSREEKLFERDHVHSNSQQKMLNSLSKLKQNIVSHTATITNRVRDVL